MTKYCYSHESNLNSDLFWGCPGAFPAGAQRSPEARYVMLCAYSRSRASMSVTVCVWGGGAC